MTHDEMIAVIQAHKEGKRIDCSIKGRDEWESAPSPVWNFFGFDYRIARQPRKVWVKWNKNTADPCAWSKVSSSPEPGCQEVTEQL